MRFQPSFLVTAGYAPDAPVRREPYRAAHLAHMADLLTAGSALVVGALADLSASVLVLHADSAEAARSIVERDPYWQHRVWTSIEVAPYLVATVNDIGR